MRFLSLAVCAVLGCATAPPPPPLTCPNDGGPSWHLAISQHFTLYTDAPSDEAERLSGELERTWALIAHALLHSASPPSQVVRVVLFRNAVEFERFRSLPSVVGFHGVENDVLRRSIVVAYDGDALGRTLRHELTHEFLHRFAPAVPRWLDEGLAEWDEAVVTRNIRNGMQPTRHVLVSLPPPRSDGARLPTVDSLRAEPDAFFAEDPTSTTFDALASLLFATGDPRGALAAELRAIDLLPDGAGPPAEMLARRERYRRWVAPPTKPR